MACNTLGASENKEERSSTGHRVRVKKMLLVPDDRSDKDGRSGYSSYSPTGPPRLRSWLFTPRSDATCLQLAIILTLDESTYIQDITQLTVFIHYTSSDVTVKEEMLDLVALKETTCGADIRNTLERTSTNTGAPLNKLVSVATYGAPAMVGKHAGSIALMKEDPSFLEFLPVHCFIHRKHLEARYFKYEDVIKSVLEIVSFIRSNGKSHRQFRNVIEELDLEDKPSDVSFYCIVKWLSTSNILSRFVDLLEPIITFLKEKKRSYPQLENHESMQDLMFLNDIMNHLQILNLTPQWRNKIVSDLTQAIFGLQSKISFSKRLIVKKLQALSQSQ
ncbi:general transcription factor II-I repeat domain-containing protein 2A-like [Oratosquilla oratoria]|uniref:general transcription factor II-I repeat domain-containing protein 2A-like n=1 Tax=Oratosquilla oratoria TaxID=337810 RepID=UPI003F761AC0